MNVDALRQITGDGELAAAQGLTIEDQERIDMTNVGLCRTGIWNDEECALATLRSSKRRQELRR